jgi:hypothetical protein
MTTTDVIDLWRYAPITRCRTTYRNAAALDLRDPARMVEELMGANPQPDGSWLDPEMTDERQRASVQAWAGWWDPEYRR